MRDTLKMQIYDRFLTYKEKTSKMYQNKNDALLCLFRFVWLYPDKRVRNCNFFGYIRKYSYICIVIRVIFYDSKRAVY